MKNKNIITLLTLITTSFGISQAVMAAPPSNPPDGVTKATFNSVTLTPSGSDIGLNVTGSTSGYGMLVISAAKSALLAQSNSNIEAAINAFGKTMAIIAATYDGTAVYAASNTGTAVNATSNTGVALNAYSGTDTAIAASSAITTSPTITSSNGSTGAAIGATSANGTAIVGTGKIGVLGTSNTNTGVFGQSNANGIGLEGHSNNGFGVYGGTSAAAGRGGYFVNPSGNNVSLATGTSALSAVGNVNINDGAAGRGISLNSSDRPLITRAWDAFTSGKFLGSGRWGVFMEPNFLTLGFPDIAGRGLKISAYNADSTKTDVLTVDNDGNVNITGQLNAPNLGTYYRVAATSVIHPNTDANGATFTASSTPNVTTVPAITFNYALTASRQQWWTKISCGSKSGTQDMPIYPYWKNSVTNSLEGTPAEISIYSPPSGYTEYSQEVDWVYPNNRTKGTFIAEPGLLCFSPD